MLEDVMVVELAPFYPGPYCGKLLLELGAKVVKVEPPGGDPARSMPEFYTALNHGKEILEIDLKSEDGKNKFYELVERCDVIVEGFRPGVAKRLGVDYESVSRVKESIIYCSISAFGQETSFSQLPAHDINLLGLAGILKALGVRDLGVQLADFASATFATIAILAALYERKKSGKGCYIDVSMLKSVLYAVPILTSSLLNGKELPAQLYRNPGYGVYRTADGYVSVGIVTEEHFWKPLAEFLGLKITLREALTLNVTGEIERKLSCAKTKEFVGFCREKRIPVFEVIDMHELDELSKELGEELLREVDGIKTPSLPFKLRKA